VDDEELEFNQVSQSTSLQRIGLAVLLAIALGVLLAAFMV